MSLRTFTSEALGDLRTTSAIVPSSRYLAQAMLEPLTLARAKVVVELGPGTGALTQGLLALMPPEATLVAFEVNPRFLEYLRQRFPDRRLILVNRSAVTLQAELERRGVTQVDAAVSSLGVTFMSNGARHAVWGGLARFLTDDGVFTQYHYVHGLLPWYQKENGRLVRFRAVELLSRYFRQIERKVVWRNVPPAFVFICRK
ncbi:MAG TPA: methyltransferase [Candidatus Xenobia bacterium]|nr:methyltransferase [Candidatus Xenobia bacterium]